MHYYQVMVKMTENFSYEIHEKTMKWKKRLILYNELPSIGSVKDTQN